MDTQKIGEFIKAQRKEKNLTQKELSERLNCTDKAVSRWETGRGIPEISMLIPLSKELGVTVNELLLGEKIEKEEFEEKTEKLIVETITQSDKKVGGMKKMIFALFCFIEVLILLIMPLMAGPGDEMGVIFGSFILTAFNALLLGFTNTEIVKKLLFAPGTALLFAVSSLILPFYSSMGFSTDLLLYMGFYLEITLVFVLIGTGANKVVTYLLRRIKGKTG